MHLLNAFVNLFAMIMFLLNETNKYIIMGIGCCISWFIIPLMLDHIDNIYHVHFLVKKAPPFLLKWFISMIPLYMGCTMFAYIMFSGLS